MVTTSMPQWLQMLYRKLAQESEFDPLFDGDVNIEEGALEINDNANHCTRDWRPLFDDTDNIILSQRRMTDAE